ncbi:MAG: translocation/assembly module TamB domain-containing protein, partial [Paracoccus sp. (in: a-proteobacteria)]|nr:translocation/assembly module TamB domain-containing protein [Paracoccus sp. (in: a-proteobacteria)]
MMRRIFLLLSLCLMLPLAAPAQDAPPTDAPPETAEDDRGFVTRFLEENLSGAGRTVEIDGFRGALSSRATFDKLTIADDEGVWITLNDGAISWTRSALLLGRVEVGELSAREILLPRLPVSQDEGRTPEAVEFSLPELPVSVNIAKLDAARVEIGQPVIGEAAVVSVSGNMSLAGGEGAATLSIDRKDDKRGQFALDASYSNRSKVLGLDLVLDEDAGGIAVTLLDLPDQPALKMQVKGQGPLSDYTADIALATDGQPRVAGQAMLREETRDGAPGHAFRLDLGGDVSVLVQPDKRAFFGTNTRLLAEGWQGEQGGLSIPQLSVETDALSLSGSLQTTPTGAPQSAKLLVKLGQEAGAATSPSPLPFGGGDPTTVRTGLVNLSYDRARGDGWTLDGRLSDVRRNGISLGELTLNGAGRVDLRGESLESVNGTLEFQAKGIAPDDPALAQAIGESITGRSGFDLTRGNALRLDGLQISGVDYGISGGIAADGLNSALTVSGALEASYDDLTRLSGVAGRPMTGRAEARIGGLYTVLSGAFDTELEVLGHDITLDQKQVDGLLRGQSQIFVSARRDEAGLEVRDISVVAQGLDVQANGMLTSLGSNLEARISAPDLSRMDPSMSGGANLTAFVSGPAGARRLTISGDADELRTGIAEIDGAFAGKTGLSAIAQEHDGKYVLETFRLSNPQLNAEGQGSFQTGKIDADLRFSVADLAVLGRGWAGGLSARARLTEANGTRAIDLTGEGRDLKIGRPDLDGALAGTTRLTLDGEETAGVYTVRSFALSNNQMTATASGVVGGGKTDASAQVAMADLSAIGAGWNGTLRADAKVTESEGVRRIVVDGTGRDIAFGPVPEGAMSGPTTLALRATEQAGTLTIEQAELTNDQIVARAQGVIGQGRTDATAKIDVKTLASLGLGWRGSLTADAVFADDGTGRRRLSVDGLAQDLSLGQAQVDAALSGPTRLTVRATEEDGTFQIEEATLDNNRLNARATGSVGGGRTDVSADLRAADLAFLGRGMGGAISASGQVTETDGARRISARGTATNLRVGNPQADAVLAGTTNFDLAATQRGSEVQIQRLEARNPQLQVVADGVMDGAARRVNLDARLTDLALLVPGFPGAVGVAGVIHDRGNRYEADLTATGPNTRATITGTAAKDFATTDLRVNGTTDAAVANPFLRTRALEGPVSLDLRLQGPPALESLSGRVSLSGGRLADPGLGVAVSGLDLTAGFDRGRISVDGGGNVDGGGRISVSGPVDLRGNRDMDVRVRLDRVNFRDPNLYQTTASGDLRISGPQSLGATISGRIDLTETEIRIPSTGLGGAKAIPDIIHKSDRPPVRATRAKAGLAPFPSQASREAGMSGPAATPPANPMKLDILISAPRQVFVRGRGIDAELGGDLRLGGTTRNMIPIGHLELIRGRVDLLGKRFVLDQGLIELQGSMVPVVRFVAITEQDGITTRITIDGEASDPEITFSADPDMPQEEVLSQLLFGRGLDTISPLQAAQLANAVAVLAGRGGEGIVGNLRQQVGLDDLDLATDAEGNVSVRAGKYLSENVYTDVQVGADGTSK